MIYLLDVNLLVALFDRLHVNHESAHEWFARHAIESWASCPITENGFLRVVSSPAYPTVTATPAEAMEHLERFRTHPGHVFWPDEVSLIDVLDGSLRSLLSGHGQITDYYLAALANHRGGRLATFDGSLVRSLAGTRLFQRLEIVR
jgi:toxin-antitoxin system PIN domain toxin